ncbi:hypothetical protein AKJ16_DCAP02984 [Drosera capensis]
MATTSPAAQCSSFSGACNHRDLRIMRTLSVRFNNGSNSSNLMFVRAAYRSTGDVHRRRSSLEPRFCYDKVIPEQIIEKPVGISIAEKFIGEKPRCSHCQVRGVVLCATCSGSGLYVDSIMESQGIIVKVRCIGFGQRFRISPVLECMEAAESEACIKLKNRKTYKKLYMVPCRSKGLGFLSNQINLLDISCGLDQRHTTTPVGMARLCSPSYWATIVGPFDHSRKAQTNAALEP